MPWPGTMGPIPPRPRGRAWRWPQAYNWQCSRLGTSAARFRQCAQPRDAITTAISDMVAAVQLNLSPLGLTADERDRNVPHGRIGLGAMPVALASLDVCHIADIDLALLMLRRHDAGARSHDQDLVAIVDMPSCIAALAEVHHGAVVVLGVAGLDDGLACPRYRARPAGGPLSGTFGRSIWDVLKGDDLHDACLPLV